GVLQIENDAVGREIARFFQRPRVRPRHEQQTAARTDHGFGPLDSSDTMSPVRSDRIRHISIILFEHGLPEHRAPFSGYALTVRSPARKTCSSPALMVSHCHVTVSATTAPRLS